MAKRIKNPITIELTQYTEIDNLTDEEITIKSCELYYGVECDCELEERRSFVPELSPQEQAVFDQVIQSGLAKISEHEGIV